MRSLLGLPHLSLVFSTRWLARMDADTLVLRAPNRASYLGVLLDMSRVWGAK